ncbi:3-hydroxybutyryl-CoA dehydrogenase [Persicobacter diffluens]|uniref:3-hydroxybutyryl-CoA dehydrogenase n=1 Tax=Persicobacter diffluens TaxID=981 RepID=A0AAN4VXF9_9BACT|nr:3-hydroxybutyryl-CoA dehydrogenase [Persicobacter diffluens]
MQLIAVIGAGTMGNGIAHVFAQSGFEVNLVDLDPSVLERGTLTISKNLDRLIAKDKITEEDKDQTLARIHKFTALEAAVVKASIVVEAVSESEHLKTRIFESLSQYCDPETILATNTSSISITKLAASVRNPERVIGMHFMNPVPLMKLVEVIRGYSTSDEVCAQIMQVAQQLGKVAVEVNDYPGFVANRILMPMINEAIESLFEGVAGVEEIDTVMKLGMAHPMGPLQLADFIGLDVCLAILRVMHEGLGKPKFAPCPLLVNMVTAGKLGVKSGEGFYDYRESKKAEKVSARFLKV